MKPDNSTHGTRGQALVELAILLPVLIILAAAVIPLCTRATLPLWLDERLVFRQLGPDHGRLHDRLARVHDTDFLPAYFKERDLGEYRSEETASNRWGGLYPGKVRRQGIVAALNSQKGWHGKLIENDHNGILEVTRKLTMTTLNNLEEHHVAETVRNRSLAGVLRGKASLLRRAGLSFFHINLDALPPGTGKGKTGGGTREGP